MVAFPVAWAAGATGRASVFQAWPLQGPIMLMAGNSLPCPPPRDPPATQGSKWGATFPTGDLLAGGQHLEHLQLGWWYDTGGVRLTTPPSPPRLGCLAGWAQPPRAWPVPSPGLPGGCPSPGANAAQRGHWAPTGTLAAPEAQSWRGCAEACSPAPSIVKLLPLPIFIFFFSFIIIVTSAGPERLKALRR